MSNVSIDDINAGLVRNEILMKHNMQDSKTTKTDIEKWLTKLGITTFTIREDGNVDVSGDVILDNKLGKLEKLPVIFSYVSGSFSCAHNKLVSLQGAPRIIDGNFNCSFNRLTSLAGCPEIIGGSFECWSNRLTSLNEGPRIVGASYNCSCNRLTSLDGAPKVVEGEFNCSCNYLTNLQGGPERAKDYDCYHCHLKSLEGAPKELPGKFLCYWNELTSLEGGPQKVGGEFVCWSNKLKNLLGGPVEVGGVFNCDRVGKAPKLNSLEGAPRICKGFSYAGLAVLDDFQGKEIPEYMKDYLPASWWDTHTQILHTRIRLSKTPDVIIPPEALLEIKDSINALSREREDWCLYIEERQSNRTLEKMCYFSSDVTVLWNIFKRTFETYRLGKQLLKSEFVEYRRTTFDEYESNVAPKGDIRITAMAIVKSSVLLDGFGWLQFLGYNGIRNERWKFDHLCTLTMKSKKLLDTTGIPEALKFIEA